MRTAGLSHVSQSDSDELLTTGEAALLLSCSRQHVVDLCNSGELPYVTSGTHRRVYRRDVEALRERTGRLSRDQRRSRWLNMAVAGELVSDPQRVLAAARSNLEKARQVHRRGQGAFWLDRWEQLLDGPLDRVLEALTSPAPWAREMRQNSPFSGVLDEALRQQVLEAFRQDEQGGARPAASRHTPRRPGHRPDHPGRAHADEQR